MTTTTKASESTRCWKLTASGQAAVARYEDSEKGRETRRRNRRLYKQRHAEQTREMRRIGMRVRHAVLSGRLTKEPCLVCGSDGVQAHHHNGYAPEHELDVIWVCSRHHADAHGRVRKVAA